MSSGSLIPSYPPLTEFTRPYAEKFNLTTLPLHIHEVLIAVVFYHLVFLASAFFSAVIFRRHYLALKPRTRVNWDVHVVSLVQSTFISGLALYVIWFDRNRNEVEHKVFGYTPLAGTTQAFALGYFVWDLCMSAAYFEIFGIGFLMHALSAVVVFALDFRPFVNFYGPVFILFELSSPFLNFHWFFDKLNMTGSKPQWYNGMLLLTVFFFCRVLWGPYQTIKVFRDIYDAYMNPPLTREEGIPIPTWLVLVYLGSNILLNSLNYYWFSRMIETVRKRFTEPKVKAKEAKKEL